MQDLTYLCSSCMSLVKSLLNMCKKNTMNTQIFGKWPIITEIIGRLPIIKNWSIIGRLIGLAD